MGPNTPSPTPTQVSMKLGQGFLGTLHSFSGASQQLQPPKASLLGPHKAGKHKVTARTLHSDIWSLGLGLEFVLLTKMDLTEFRPKPQKW